jgi:uncharacterized protein YkwD
VPDFTDKIKGMDSPAGWLLTLLLLAPAAPGQPPWLDEVFEHVLSGREEAGSGPVERRDLLDTAARAYAQEVADQPHANRLIQRRSIDSHLRDHGVEGFRMAQLHLDMGRGYSDWGAKFKLSWKDHLPGWNSVTDARYDAIGLGVAKGDDDWVVLVGILVEDIRLPTDLRSIEDRALERVNETREEHGLGTLEHDETLARLARHYSEQMASLGFFSHTGADGSSLEDRARRHGIRYQAIAENLHQSKGYDDAVPVAIRGWMNSPGHRANLLGREYTRSAVGVALSADGDVIFTQLFLQSKSGR